MLSAVLCVALIQQLSAPPPTLTATRPVSEDSVRSPSLYVRPLASLLVPGTGQLMAGQDRGAVYLAAEIYLLSRYLQLDHQATQEAQRCQNLAFDVARRTFQPAGKDTVFEYYEQMGRFVESGAYDADGPGGTFVPEPDAKTYNGSVWLLARRTFWADPNVPPDPTSWQYAQSLEFYRARAVTPSFQWSWREHSLEHQVFGDYMRSSDDAFRKAQSQIGLLLANHLVSAIDALISARMSAAAGRNAEMRTSVGIGGRSQVRFSISF
jgi:hypothetical protein